MQLDQVAFNISKNIIKVTFTSLYSNNSLQFAHMMKHKKKPLRRV